MVGTAVAHVPTDQEIEQIRQAGKQVVARQKELNHLFRTLEGMQWGSGNSLVRGDQFSQQTRYALAQFCLVTRANPLTHVDMLGGKPYLNESYWTDLLNQHDHFIRYEQRDLSPAVETALRERAARHREVANDLPDGPEKANRVGKALDLEEEAEDLALARAQWSPRETATVVVETTIYRLINAAPIAAIKSGQIDNLEPYIVKVAECNWAGGMGNTLADRKKYDPIGDTYPGQTARSRSLRRCAKKAFSAWMEEYDTQLHKAEEAVEAEFEIIQENGRNALPESGPQAVATGSGEPEAGDLQEAEPLSVEGEEPAEKPKAKSRAKKNEPEPEPEEEKFDRRDYQKRLFATLRDSGVKGDDRKAWAKEHGLPESTADWSLADFEKALEILVGPTRTRVVELAGKDLPDLSLRVLQKESPDHLKDWQALLTVLEAQEETEEEEEQEAMDL